MGPLYGSFFLGLAETLSGKETLDATLFGEALAKYFGGAPDERTLERLRPNHR